MGKWAINPECFAPLILSVIVSVPSKRTKRRCMQITADQFEQAKKVAYNWQQSISISREKSEQKLHEMMRRMLEDPINKVFLIELLDQSFRSNDSKRVANQLEYIFKTYGKTELFSQLEQLLLWGFRHVGVFFPKFSIPLFIKYLRNDINTIVIKGESKALSRHLKYRKGEGTRVNINLIGEAVLGENEARERIQKYKKALENPDIDYISVKISTIFSQIAPLAHEWSVEEIKNRLTEIYAAAMQNTFTDSTGKITNKFVNLDMEEYRDLHLTIDTFKQTLDLPQFQTLHAGIVFQAYLPDAVSELKKLITWAKTRVESGGAPIKVRLVKGANQEMELTESSLRDWSCVTFLDKALSDANYKIAMDLLLHPDVAPYVHTGIASHNLFDQALAHIIAKDRNVLEYYSSEMLEGMSETAYKTLKKEGINVILYAPIATAQTFTNAIAYLVRRFDENTADQNFLRHSFGLEVDTPEWEALVESYERSVSMIPMTPQTPFRKQNRNKQPILEELDLEMYHFKNAEDTDFVLPQNRKWAEAVRDKWMNIGQSGGYHVHPVINGETKEGSDLKKVMDKSQHHDEVEVGSFTHATKEDLLRAVDIAISDPDGWRELSVDARQKILMQAAVEIEKRRGDLIGVAAAEVGKVFTETDVEVTEAIDFLNFYPYSVRQVEGLTGVHTRGKGVGLVISPWNFPVAIPTGGVAAALAAGNTVLLKPASDAVLCSALLCECLWAAGVSKKTLQFVPCTGATAGEVLIPHEGVDFVIFTGGEDTAFKMLEKKPELFLSAETGGKDATIVTSMADKDQAIKNVVAAAFNNSGQKCSATSLLVLEEEVYRDQAFHETLVDAAVSLEVGSVWDFKNRIGTLSNLPGEKLNHALTHLDDEERWLLSPTIKENNPFMLVPSIRKGTKVGDYCHTNELFGPVLSIMQAMDLEDGINIVNATGYGLTSGLESLDKREQEIWKETLKAGNLYINRSTTGAIVLRQPFGGMGKSAIGSGRKAGGFNYCAQFMHIQSNGSMLYKSTHHPRVERLHAMLDGERYFLSHIQKSIQIASHFASFLYDEFLQEHDYVNIRGESNHIRYLNVQSILLRFEEEDSLVEMLVSIVAAKMADANVLISLPKNLTNEHMLWLQKKVSILIDVEDQIIQHDSDLLLSAIKDVQRVRFLRPEHVTKAFHEEAVKESVHIASAPFVAHGRIELMHYFLEQSISNSYHRYGNLGYKGLMKRSAK